MPEEWGGDTVFVPISAKKGENIPKLLEMIALVAELEVLEANYDRPAEGTVLESHLDKLRGPVANLLVQVGTLKVRYCCYPRSQKQTQLEAWTCCLALLHCAAAAVLLLERLLAEQIRCTTAL